jgi:hypothetical protein
MATLGDFGSLLQLGFGIGIGLSLFRAPFVLRTRRLTSALRDHGKIVAGVATTEAKERQGTLASLSLELSDAISRLEKWYLPFLVSALFGAAVNLVLLVWASISSGTTIDQAAMAWLIFAAVGYYALVLLILEVIARLVLAKVVGGLDRLN